MGANNSSPKASPQTRRKHHHKEQRPQGQDVVRSNKPIAAEDSYRQSPNIHVGGPIERTDTVTSGPYDNNTEPEARVTVHTDIPSQIRSTTPTEHRKTYHDTRQHHDKHDEKRHSPKPKDHTDKPEDNSARHQQTKSHGHHQSSGNIHLGADNEHSPAVLLSTPQVSEPNKQHKGQTIKGAKVNVKERMSMFTELAVKDDSRPRAASSHGNLLAHNNHLSVAQTHDASVRRGSEASALRHLHHSKPIEPVFTQRMEDENKSKRPVQSNRRSEKRRGSEPAIVVDNHLKLPHQKENSVAIPAPDYEDKRGANGGVTMTVDGKRPIARTNTLELFDKLTSEHQLLNKFEKAKPARIHHKGNSPLQNRAYKQRAQKPDVDLRPKSMFLPLTDYNNDLVVPTARNHSYFSNSDLVSANESESDEDHTPKKKIVGQRLPFGAVDKETESKFLKSLKRNMERREASNLTSANGQGTSKSLENLVF